MTKLDDLRSAHIEGATFAAYIDKAESIITAGADGDVRVYPGLYDDETLSVSLGSKITSLAVKDDLVVLSNEQNEVKAFVLPKMTLENILLRFTASVNHVCINDDKKKIAAGSSDFSIKTVLRDGTEQKTLTGHTAPVLSVCFIGEQFLASSSCDGSVRIWNLLDQKCSNVLDILPKFNSVPKCQGIMSVCTKSQLLGIPAGPAIKVLSTLTFQEEFVLDKEHTEPVSNVDWSSCGQFLTSGSSNGEIFCWNTQSKTCIKKSRHHESKSVTCLAWKPNSNEILYADNEGEFGTCEMPIEAKKESNDNFGFDDGDDDIISSAFLGPNEDDDENTNDGDIFPTSAAKKGKKRSLQIDNDDDDDDDDDVRKSEKDVTMPSKKTRINNMGNFLDDQADEDEEDDEASISLNLIKEGFLEPIRQSVIDDEEDDTASMASFITKDEKPTKKETVVAAVQYFMQPPFQPSATPIHLQHRFMAWNSTGIIRCHRDDEVSAIDVEFHNASTSHPLHIPNVLDNTMAALSNTAVVFACKRQDNIPSKLTCIHFASWDNNKEWSISMNDEEDIEAIAANNAQICVATSKRVIRVFTVGGLQTQLLQLPGPVVSMAMHEKEIIVLYHKSTGLDKCQCLGISQYICKKMTWKFISDESLFMKRETTVVWLGFSCEGTPVFVTSSGEVLLYHRNQQAWLEIGNTKKTVKNKSDNYWIIGVEEQQAQLRCIYCKGANFPALLPRPIPTMIPFQVPLCEMKTEKSIKEHELIKNGLLASNMVYSQRVLRLPVEHDGSDRQQIQLLMQLFALACKADREYRAVEICKLMPSADSVSLAIQYASKIKRMNIARKLTELAQTKAAAEEEEEGEDEDESEEEQSEEEPSDEEIEIEENKENNRKSIIRTKTTSLSRGLGRSNSIPRKKSETVEEANSSEDEDVEEEEEITKKSVQKEENVTPKPKLGGNPFKVSQQNGSSQKSGAKGTGYFETMESQKLSKAKQAQKNINNVAMKKKSSKIPSKGKIEKSFKGKEKIDFSVAKTQVAKSEETTKKTTTGFQLFLEEQKNCVEGSQTDFIPAAMKLWKELDSEEKKEWNNKAKAQSNAPLSNNNINNENNQAQQSKKSDSLSVKSKLSSFAFQKT